jgi:hypothetical protein
MNQNAFDQALYSRLSTTSALVGVLGGTAIYKDLAPQGTKPPYVLFNKMSNVPAYTLTRLAFENMTYQVKAITTGFTSTAAGQIAKEVDTALQDTVLTIAGHLHVYIRRIEDVDYLEPAEGGLVYKHLGGIYRVMATPT